MPYAHILIILMLGNGTASNPKAVATQEFSTRDACMLARAWVNRDTNSTAECFPK